MIAWFALIALAFTPLVIDFAARDDSYMAPKWAWIAVLAALGLAATLARAVAGRAVVLPVGEVFVAAVVFMAWHWIAALWAPSGSLAIERAARVSWLTVVILLGYQLLFTRRHLLLFGKIIFGVGVTTALWVLLEDGVRAWAPERVWIRSNLGDWRGYLAAGLGNTNHIGDLLALTMLGGLAAFARARTRLSTLLWGVGIALQTAALIVSFSVGSNLGLIVGSLLMLGLMLRQERLGFFTAHKARWGALLLAWGVILVVLNTDNALNPHRPGILAQGFDSGRWHAGGPTRLAIWAQTLEMIRQHTLLGAGTGNFTFLFPQMDSMLIADRPDLLIYQGMWTNAAHNELLQAWAEQGIGGLVLLLALTAVAFFALGKGLGAADAEGAQIRIALIGLLAAYCAQGQMNFVLQTPAGALTFYALLLAVLIEKRARPERASMPPLIFETGTVAIRVDWQSMDKPTAVGAALLLPDAVALGLGLAMLATAAIGIPRMTAAVRAQREYARVYTAPDAGQQEEHYLRALAIAPRAENVRSDYAKWLLAQGRPGQALEEIAIVRERLNSNELFEREAQALAQLGRGAEAQAKVEELKRRVRRARDRQPAAE